MEPYGTLMDPTGSCGILRNPTESYRILRDPRGTKGNIRDLNGSYKTFKGPYRTLWNPTEPYGMTAPYGTLRDATGAYVTDHKGL